MGFLSGGATPPPAKATGWIKIANFIMQNGRGFIGSIPLIVLTLMLLIKYDEMRKNTEKNLLFVFIVMGSCLLIHPVKVSAVAFIPIFAFPLLHIIDSANICKAYFCANTGLMIVGGYLHQIINSSGWDKRLALWLLRTKSDSSSSLIVRCSITAYVLAMISDRQHTTKFIMAEVVGNIRQNEDKKTRKRGAKDKEFKDLPENKDPVCAVLANAIATSSTIGSLAIVHGARNVMFMRSLWEMAGHDDTFNFFDYSAFALPLTLVMFAMNLGYSIMVSKIVGIAWLISCVAKLLTLYSLALQALVSQTLHFSKNMWLGRFVLTGTIVKQKSNELESISGLAALQSSMTSSRSKIPNKATTHEILTIVFTGVSLILYFTRWSQVIFKMTKKTRGWADSKMWTSEVVSKSNVPDFTVAAGITILCCILPSTFNFIKTLKASKESELPLKKADSSIIFWKFVDKHTNYGYMFLVGAFVALHQGIVKCPLFTPYYLVPYFKFMETTSVAMSTLLWVVFTGMLSNIMTSVATAGLLTVVVLHCPVGLFGYRFALATGIASSFGFMAHFKYTPVYTVKTVAGISKMNQIKYSCGSVIICILMLWMGINFYAPMIFEGPQPVVLDTEAPAVPPEA